MKKFLPIILIGLLLTACSKNSSDDHFQLAQQALKENNHKAAIIELKNAIRLEPKNATFRFLLGKTYLDLRQLNEAEKELERALAEGYSSSEIVPLLSSIYKYTGEHAGLYKLSKKAKGLQPSGLAKLKFYQLQAYLSEVDKTAAQTLIEEIKAIAKAAEFGDLARAYDFILKEQFDDAFTQIESVLARLPNQPDALQLKAQLQLNNQQPELAVKTYETYLTAYPNDINIQFVLARLYSDLRQSENAEPIIDDLLKKYPEQQLLLQLKASARAIQKDYKEALTFANRIIEITPDDTPARLIGGVSAYHLNELTQANQHLSLIASQLPADHLALRMLADTQVRLGMALEANNTIQRFDKLSEQDAGLLSGVGRALLAEGEVNKAKTVLAKQPDNIERADVKASVAYLKLSLNDVTGILDLENALKQAEDTPQESAINAEQVETTLAKAYLASKQYDKALELAKKWQKDDKTTLSGWLFQGLVQRTEGKNKEAQEAYQQALTIEPNSPYIQLQLLSLAANNDQELQLKELEKLIEEHPTYLPAILTHYLSTKALKKPQSMTQHIERQLLSSPKDKSLTLALGRIWLLENDHIKAIQAFEEIKSETPEEFWRYLATAYIKNKQFEQASQLYEAWFKAAPNHPSAISGQIKSYIGQGELKKALTLADRYINDLGGENPEILLLRLKLLAQQALWPQTQRALAELPQHLQEVPFSQGIKGQLAYSKGNFEDAHEKLSIAYQASPSPSNALWMSNAIDKHQGKSKATAFLKAHKAQQPEDVVNTLRYANLVIETDVNEAIDTYRQIVTKNKRNFIAYNNLAHLLEQQGKTSEAYQYSMLSYEIAPNNISVLDTLANIELKLNKHTEALKHLESAYSLSKDNLPEGTWILYVKALLLNGKNELAKRRIQQFQPTQPEVIKQLSELKKQYL